MRVVRGVLALGERGARVIYLPQTAGAVALGSLTITQAIIPSMMTLPHNISALWDWTKL